METDAKPENNEASANDTEMKDASKKTDTETKENGDEKPEATAEEEKAKQKRSKKKVTTILPIAGKFINSITNDQFNKWHELEVQLYTAV